MTLNVSSGGMVKGPHNDQMDVANEALPHGLRLEERGKASCTIMSENFVPLDSGFKEVDPAFDLQVMENERTREFRLWCINGEDKDMWVALGLICRRFARHSQSASVTTFRVWSDLEDDIVAVDGVTTTTKWFSWCGLVRVVVEVARFGGVNGGFAMMVEDDDDFWLATDGEVKVVEIGFDTARMDITANLRRELGLGDCLAATQDSDSGGTIAARRKGRVIRTFLERMMMWQLTWQRKKRDVAMKKHEDLKTYHFQEGGDDDKPPSQGTNH
ncbi:hypothetical protein V8G54_020127 [Vigna mungo]|uniref:Uncharacterized protein n=1 Tax=Vigna mungo TaxID=3915 RepID=A0AAQ3RWE5_VIGMU